MLPRSPADHSSAAPKPGDQAPKPADQNGEKLTFATKEERDEYLRSRQAEFNSRRVQELEREIADRDQRIMRNEEIIASLATQRSTDPNQTTSTRDDSSRVDPRYTEPLGTRPQTRFDPWDPEAAEKWVLDQIVHNLDRAGKRFMDWYLNDRKQVWDAATKQDTLTVSMAIEVADLVRQHPELSARELYELAQKAPEHGFSLAKTYENRYGERDRASWMETEREKIRKEERDKAQAEFERSTRLPMPAPVLGPAAPPQIRRNGEPAARPKSYADATRQAIESAGSKLFTT